MKFNKNAFLFIVLGMVALYCAYYAFLYRNNLSQVLTYLGIGLLFVAGSLHFRNKMEKQEVSNKIVKKDRKRKNQQ